jgi:hypothetical protein
LYPRNAANRLPTGGRFATSCATDAETPCSCKPVLIAAGSVLANPMIMREKKIPMESDEPALKKVARTPEAAPRSAAGTLDMIAAVFGAVKIPPPRPLINTRSANTQ